MLPNHGKWEEPRKEDLSLRSMSHFWGFECTLKVYFFVGLSVRSKSTFRGVWAYAQWPLFEGFEHTLNGTFSKGLSVRSMAHFRWTFSHENILWFTSSSSDQRFFLFKSTPKTGKQKSSISFNSNDLRSYSSWISLNSIN